MRCLFGAGSTSWLDDRSTEKIDQLAAEALIPWSGATSVYPCGESAGGATVTCVDSSNIPSFEDRAAVTWGTYIFCRAACADAVLLAHEMVHVHQFEVNGDRMGVSYLYRHIRHGYTNSPYEVEAYRVEESLPWAGG